MGLLSFPHHRHRWAPTDAVAGFRYLKRVPAVAFCDSFHQRHCLDHFEVQAAFFFPFELNEVALVGEVSFLCVGQGRSGSCLVAGR